MFSSSSLIFSTTTHPVSKFRLEKWEKGIHPNYEDGQKIKNFFRVKDIQNFSEDFLESFEPEQKGVGTEAILNLKDQLLEEKDKRIDLLEETINELREELAEYKTKKKS